MVSRAFGYPSDVWALGVSIVHMDLAQVPFGRERMHKQEIDKVFFDALNKISGWTPTLGSFLLRKFEKIRSDF